MGSSAWRMYRLDRNSLKRYFAFQGARPQCEGNFPRGEPPHEIQVGERFWAHTTGKQRRTKYYCFPPDVMVAGSCQPIQECNVGDCVAGVPQSSPIIRTFQRQYDGPTVRINACGIFPIQVTPEHPFLVVTASWGESRQPISSWPSLKFSDPYWKPAKEIIPFHNHSPRVNTIRGDCLVMPRTTGNVNSRAIDLTAYMSTRGRSLITTKQRGITSFPLTTDTAWLLGMYVAEGCLQDKGGKISGHPAFIIGRHETRLRQRLCKIIRDLRFRPTVRDTRTAQMILIPSVVLGRVFPEWCGSGAKLKRIPSFILKHQNLSICRGFMDGYWAGDGHWVEHRNMFESTTVSRRLAFETQLLLARLGLYGRISIVKIAPKMLEGRFLRGGTAYNVSCTMKQLVKLGFFVTQDSILVRVKQVDAGQFNGTVYNLETQNGTYLANNVVVHNCQRHKKLLYEMGAVPE